jgi:hypothetical protein
LFGATLHTVSPATSELEYFPPISASHCRYSRGIACFDWLQITKVM